MQESDHQESDDMDAAPDRALPRVAGVADGASSGPRAPGESGLAHELIRGLPCIRCTYDLRGLSVRGVCPECGTPIRATILARVDPLAKELQPLYTPKLTAGCMILWTVAALSAAIASWVPRAIEALNRLDRPIHQPEWPALAALVGVGVSGLASLALIRPHRLIPAWQCWVALAGSLAYVPLVLCVRRIAVVLAGRDPNPYLGVGGIDPARATWRLAVDVLMLVILVGLRPNARVLASRSFVLRTGQVDRQTMLAMAAAVGVCAIGDLLSILAGATPPSAQGAPGAMSDVLRVGAVLFIGVGSLLITLGLGSMVLDTVRLFSVIAQPPLSLSDLTRPADPAASSIEAAKDRS